MEVNKSFQKIEGRLNKELEFVLQDHSEKSCLGSLD